jgi:membrane protease YdiL (CAAX protease family)
MKGSRMAKGAQEQFLTGADLARRPTSLVTGILVALVLIVLSILASTVVPVQGDPSGLIGTLVGFGVIWVGVAAWLRVKEQRPFSTVGLEHRGGLRKAARGALIGVAGVGVIVAIGVTSGNLVLIAGDGEVVRWASLPLVGAGLLVCLVQGGAEEILCRGFLLQTLARRLAWPVAVIVQAVVFSGAHAAVPGFGAIAFINIALMGIALGLWAVAEGSLWGVLAFHGAWNWAQSGLWGIGEAENALSASLMTFEPVTNPDTTITGGVLGIETSLLTTVVAVVAIIALVFAGARKRRRQVA